MILVIATIAVIWVIGTYHMWRKQTASIDLVSVTVLDRILALFWPFIYVFLLFTMVWGWFNGRHGRGHSPGG